MLNTSPGSTPAFFGLRNVLAQWLVRHEREFDHDTMRVVLLAWVGLFGLPLYYVIWRWSFPQPYENLPLRVLGTLLCVALLAFLPRLQPRAQRVFAFATVTYTLPFLFTFMYLMNQGSPVWSQSLLVELIILFHFRVRWAMSSCLVGTALAAALFVTLADNPAFLTSRTVLEQVPISVFTIFVVSIAKVGRRMLAQEKLAGMAQGLASVAHELRTPLVSVDANVRGMSRLLKREGDAADLEHLGDALARIQFEVRHMNHLVDLFLLSATAARRKLEPTERVSMSEVVHSVLRRYPFVSQQQRAFVAVEVRSDFTFAGQHELGVVVLLNLLRNALKALHRAGKGRVRIIVDGTRQIPRLLFIDTGCGIAPAQLPNIFKRFYSFPPSTGSGIGLALCKEILDAWHASIRCVSRELAYTMFVLEFPNHAPRLMACTNRPNE
jgi:two-component system CAI-1 autoinducer sensor kinase/phosphatase CqsS